MYCDIILAGFAWVFNEKTAVVRDYLHSCMEYTKAKQIVGGANNSAEF